MLEHIVQITQIAGLIVITATLIFIALQVKQGADMMRSEARQAQITLDQEFVSRVIEHPEIGRVFSQSETPTLEEKT